MKINFAGDAALLIQVGSAAEAQRLRAAVAARNIGGIEDLVPAQETLLIQADPLHVDLEQLAYDLPLLAGSLPPMRAPRKHVIPVCYDGEDLGELARRLKMDVAEIVRRHAAVAYTVEFLGFAPGFPYLTGLDPLLRVPRLDSPRTRVTAGSVAMADVYTGIYPEPTPGGWWLLGHTHLTLFDARRPSPALLSPGDVVRFEAAS